MCVHGIIVAAKIGANNVWSAATVLNGIFREKIARSGELGVPLPLFIACGGP